MTLESSRVLIPDLLKICSPDHVIGMADEQLKLRLEKIDRLLEDKNVSEHLRGVLITARGTILKVVEMRME